MRNSRMVLMAMGLLTCSVAADALEMDGWTWSGGFTGELIDGDVFDPDSELYPGWLCDPCRDPEDFPVDFAALAFNAYWGAEPWARDSELGIPFRIYNLELDWVAVWFEGIMFDPPTLLPNTMEIRMRMPDGRVITVTVLQGGPDMPVGDQTPGGSESGSGGQGGGSDEGDEDYEEPEEDWPEAPEDPDYEGTVDIVDPDDDGDFPDWDEEDEIEEET